MRNTILRCGACGAAMPFPNATGAGTLGCNVCRRVSQAWLFPALFRAPETRAAHAHAEDGQSSCMNHPHKKAVTLCDGCGKYLCALCDILWNDEHLCSTCIQHRKDSNYRGAYRTVYIHYDYIALLVALISVPSMILAGFFAPVALYLAWRYWREPWRPVPHRKWAMIAAVLIANLSFISWVSFIVFAIVNL